MLLLEERVYEDAMAAVEGEELLVWGGSAKDCGLKTLLNDAVSS